MNFGQNLYNWFLSNAQSLVLLAIDVIGLCLNKTVLLWNISGFLMFRKGMVHQTKCGRDF